MSESNLSTQSENPPDQRLLAINEWLRGVLLEGFEPLEPASSDASFRRYFRTVSQGRSYIIMDAPPAQEDSRPFIKVADLLAQAGLHAPRVLAQDLAQGFLLLTDMGSQTYMSAVQTGDADSLMRDAVDALVVWQQASREQVLPLYDRALLQRELDLFPDWYVARHLQRELNADQREDWQQVCHLLVDAALAQPRVYVHRDYMPRNLMVCDPNPGILDFQDAVEGPIAYDVLSLFKDAFLSWAPEQVAGWRHYYWAQAQAAGLPVGEEADFIRAFDWIGLQRHLKVIGIFARIRYRDGKPHYLEDVPRFVRYIREVLPAYEEMLPLARLFDSLGMAA